MNLEFKAWPKIPRGSPFTGVITEKMNGTNACVIIEDDVVVGAQSRNKLIYPEGTEGKEKGCDNAGFAQWVDANKEELAKLGDGYHYGEWCGPSIQSNPHRLPEKMFFLFNSFRWGKNPDRPACCSVVRELFSGYIDEQVIQEVMGYLHFDASCKEYTPEGIVIYWKTFRSYTKHTFENAEGKWKELPS